MDSRVSLRAGKNLLDGYRLKRLIGEGAFGHVWETDGPDGENLALKFIRTGSDQAAPHEIRNILNVKTLTHPHLIRVDRVWADRGYTVIVMELADGSLLEVLAICRQDFGTPILPDYACYYLSQAADALDFLNATQHKVGGNVVGIQHCDIKPSNLLIAGETIKLCDFGLACTLSCAQGPRRSSGTPAYAAPEIYQGQISRWSDQFSLAVTYCELRGGRRPFANVPTRFDMAYVHPAPDLRMLPVDEQAIVGRALAPHPMERWRSCGEFMAHLSRVAGNRTA